MSPPVVDTGLGMVAERLQEVDCQAARKKQVLTCRNKRLSFKSIVRQRFLGKAFYIRTSPAFGVWARATF